MEKSLDSPILPFILDCIHSGIIAINREGIVIICNAAARRQMGFEDEIIGKPIASLIPGTRLQDIIKTGQTEFGKKFEFKEKIFLANRTPIVCEDEVIGAVAVFQDVTELEEISTELETFKKVNRELEGIIASSYDGIIITDGNGIVLKVNEAHLRVTELDASCYIGKKIDNLYEDGYFEFESIAKQARIRKEIVTGLQKIKTGKEVMATSTPVLDNEGNVIRVVTNARDMSDIINLQEQLARSKEISKQLRFEFNKVLEDDLKTHEVITRNPHMYKILELTKRVAGSEANVLLQGESGVGKEVFAKLTHIWSKRNGAFIKINCSALPGPLLESELFGYTRGAFTGANKEGKPGLFELADEGTLFLDEIEDLPLELQGKFLRVLQDREFIHLGGTKVIKVNVRLVVASNQDLKKMVSEQKFRSDLFYRLNVVPITIPPLRDRPEDISLLIDYYLEKFNRKYNLRKTISANVLQELLTCSWPGNIRELINTLERLVIISTEDIINETYVTSTTSILSENRVDVVPVEERIVSLKETLAKAEKRILVNTLEKFKSSRLVGEALGISHTAVLKKIKKYNL